jgi:hypothetical protein
LSEPAVATELIDRARRGYRLALDQVVTRVSGLVYGLALRILGDPEEAQDSSQEILLKEAKLACTHAMLVCLDRPHRLAYVFGEILELTGDEAGVILEVDAPTFRKRLSRARERVESFIQGRCGLVNPAVPCRCSKQIPYQLRTGVADAARPRFANHPAWTRKERLDTALASAQVFRGHPDYRAPDAFLAKVHELVEAALHG